MFCCSIEPGEIHFTPRCARQERVVFFPCPPPLASLISAYSYPVCVLKSTRQMRNFRPKPTSRSFTVIPRRDLRKPLVVLQIGAFQCTARGPGRDRSPAGNRRFPVLFEVYRQKA